MHFIVALKTNITLLFGVKIIIKNKYKNYERKQFKRYQ